MKILVIDNLSVAFPDLTRALKGYEYDVIRYNKISIDTLKKYDKIILRRRSRWVWIRQEQRFRPQKLRQKRMSIF